MFLIYQLKVGLCLIVFYLLWKMLLSRETFHRFNRAALLAVMVLALVLPWVKITLGTPSPLAQPMVTLQELLITPDGVVQQQPAASSWGIQRVATVIYLVGVAAMLLWLLYGQWRLYRLMRTGRTEALPGGITLHVLPGEVPPFSYFRHIVISEQDYRDNPNEILAHEQAHIWLLHSVDVVFIGLVALFQWWNPAAWLLGRELRQVHEYEADQAVLNNGIDARQYQLLLIKKSVGNQLFSMANSFNYQSLKKRIRMMTINKSSRWNQLRALAVVPVIALALLAFANPTIVAAPVTVDDNAAGVVSQAPELGAVETLATQDAAEPMEVEETSAPEQAPVEAEEALNEQSAPQDTKTEVYKDPDELPQFPGGEMELTKYLSQNVKYPPMAAKNNIQGRVVLQFVIDAEGQVGEVKVARSVDPELDAEAVRVVKTLPNFIPGRVNGKNVAVWYTLPLNFKMTTSDDQEK